MLRGKDKIENISKKDTAWFSVNLRKTKQKKKKEKHINYRMNMG